MIINHCFENVDGEFDTKDGQIECVVKRKDATVLLCFKSGNGENIPFATIKLHSHDRYRDAMSVLADATNLGREIARRWNTVGELERRADITYDEISEAMHLENFKRNHVLDDLTIKEVEGKEPNVRAGTCTCRSCRPHYQGMIVCPTCGNKRCPHANHHDNPCTNSNEQGQPGSAYP
jgi:hypothetical protein